MLPSIFGENLFDDFFGDPFGMMPHGRDPLYGKHAKNLMRTDVRETEDTYELDVDLPGFKKDEIHIELKNGYLTISAERNSESEKKDDKGNFVRRERSYGSFSRSFDVSSVKTDAITGEYKDGVLTLTMPKKEENVPTSRRIDIG